MNPRTILVTGADGFVGGHLCPKLVERFPQARIVAFLRPDSPGAPPIGEVVRGDIADPIAVRGALRECRPDLVVHLAAQSSAGAAADSETWRTNVGGAEALASGVAELDQEVVLLFVSSGDVYGRSLNQGSASETTELLPINTYARSKAEAEAVLSRVIAGSRTQAIICRPFNHTGPGQDERFVVPRLAAQVARIEQALQPPTVTAGDLSVRRDFLDVRDVVDAYLALIAGASRLAPYSVFNIASGRSVELARVVEQLGELARRPFAVSLDPALLRPSEVPDMIGDASALRTVTGWRPRHRFSATVRALLEHFRAKYAAASGSLAP